MITEMIFNRITAVFLVVTEKNFTSFNFQVASWEALLALAAMLTCLAFLKWYISPHLKLWIINTDLLV